MLIFNLIFIFFFGLIVGSFLAALSFRLPKNISIAKGRSFCPKCKKMIEWYNNIPVISYIFLKGRCRNCKKHISIRYPLIELFTGLGFLAIGWYFSFSLVSLIFYLFIYSLLVLIFVIDFEHQIIPDSLTFTGIIFVFFFYLLTSGQTIFASIFAGLVSATFLMAVHLATKGRGMGLGDVKFAVLGGLISGFNLFLVWLFLSFLTGGVTGIILILGQKAGLKDKIAFGPFLVIGLVLTIFFGSSFVKLLGF